MVTQKRLCAHASETSLTACTVPTNLDVVFVQWLMQVIDVNIPVQGVAGSALYKTFNLSTTEVAGDLCQHLQVHIMAQE